jgi:hypothetical protein
MHTVEDFAEDFACCEPGFSRTWTPMKKILSLMAIVGLMSAGLLVGCQKESQTPTPPVPEVPSTNAPAVTNAPAQ